MALSSGSGGGDYPVHEESESEHHFGRNLQDKLIDVDDSDSQDNHIPWNGGDSQQDNHMHRNLQDDSSPLNNSTSDSQEDPTEVYDWEVCDDLLGHFHRIVEHNNVPELQAATVAQVCLAEGTTAYVKLAAAAGSAANIKHVASVKDAFNEAYRGGKAYATAWSKVNIHAWDISVGSDDTVVILETTMGYPMLYNLKKKIWHHLQSPFKKWNHEAQEWYESKSITKFKQVEVVDKNNIYALGRYNHRVYKYNAKTDDWSLLQAMSTWEDPDGNRKDMTYARIAACSSMIYATTRTTTEKDSVLYVYTIGEGQPELVKSLSFADISMSADCKVLWTVFWGYPYLRIDLDPDEWAHPSKISSRQISACSSRSAWGVNDNNEVFSTQDRGETWNFDIDLESGDNVKLSKVAAGTPLETWGLDASNNVVRRGRAHDTYVAVIRERLNGLIEEFLVEVVTCAEGIYVHAKNTNSNFNEEFVFGMQGQLVDGKVKKIRVPVAVDTSNRNDYGLIEDLELPSFEFETFTDVIQKFDACAEKLMPKLNDGVILALDLDDREAAETNFTKAYQEYADDLTDKCISKYFSLFDDGLSLVFGGKPSPGYICGIKEAVVNQNKPMPGRCCLDAPFQLQDNDWGHAYDCSIECTRFGPLFAGMSNEACEAHGGTFCPEPSDCVELISCIAKEVTWAKQHKMAAYEYYLKEAPTNFTDTTSTKDCGLLRAFLGFDESDKQICRDVEQLKHTRDFAFLDEFFSQGSTEVDGGKGDECKCEVPPRPELVFTKPDRAVSKSKPVKNGKAWRATNHLVDTVGKALQFSKDVIDNFVCPEDFTGAIKTFCAVGKNIASVVLGIALYIAQGVSHFSEFTYNEMATIDNVGEMKISENLDALVTNMEELAEYFNSGGRIRRNLLPGNDVSSINPVETTAAVDLQVEIVSNDNPRAFLCVTMVQGAEKTPDDFELLVLDMAQKKYVSVSDCTKTQLAPGNTLVEIPDAVAGQVFTLKVIFVDDSSNKGLANATRLVAFRGQSNKEA
ncbi:expressed unknown protein [Seminavis robusta]|uniref:Uncharacterized protein n=1 Tax=Seminavis robusta TaxID=568900 RepID=A0A9N8HMC9_9STRA|nr:expressed unknown protein [Seminavis robusta]|eukprot:Sro888_g216380.1 n/a (1024) ;mRNA; f:4152-7868